MIHFPSVGLITAVYKSGNKSDMSKNGEVDVMSQ